MSSQISSCLSSLAVLLCCCCILIEPARVVQQETSYTREELEVVHLSGSSCGRDKCLVVGMDRYSEPRCEEMGQWGDYCRPGAWADNKTLIYPNKIMEVNQIYTLFCPCNPSLKCYKGTCQ